MGLSHLNRDGWQVCNCHFYMYTQQLCSQRDTQTSPSKVKNNAFRGTSPAARVVQAQQTAHMLQQAMLFLKITLKRPSSLLLVFQRDMEKKAVQPLIVTWPKTQHSSPEPGIKKLPYLPNKLTQVRSECLPSQTSFLPPAADVCHLPAKQRRNWQEILLVTRK